MIDRLDDIRERELIKAAQLSDQSALEELVHKYTPLIVKLAGRFYTVSYLKEELIQAGYEGLMKALKKYHLGGQTKLITYAFPWILGEMKHVLNSAESECKNVSFDMLESYYSELSISHNCGFEPGDAKIDLLLAFNRLSEEERQLVYWRYAKDMTQKETACKLKKSQSQISKSEKRILDWLREQLS